jgi:hypothetical protein
MILNWKNVFIGFITTLMLYAAGAWVYLHFKSFDIGISTNNC